MQFMGNWMRVRAVWHAVPDVLALVVIGICGTSVAGFVLGQPALYVDLGAHLPLAFNGCLMALFCAAFILIARPKRPLAPRWQKPFALAATAILLFTVAILIEHVAGIELHIDVSPNGPLPAATAHPGRIAPNTCLGFIGAFLSIILQAHSGPLAQRLRGRAALGFAAATIAIGLVGIAGYSFQLDALYEWYHAHQMALVTAVVLTALGTGLALRVQARLEHERGPLRADARVTLLSTLLLVGITLLSILVGFATVKIGTEDTIKRDLSQVVEAQRALLIANLQSARSLARTVAASPTIIDSLAAYQRAPLPFATPTAGPSFTPSAAAPAKGGRAGAPAAASAASAAARDLEVAQARDFLAEVGRRMRGAGIASIQFQSTDGAVIFETLPADPPELAIPLKGDFDGYSLLWDGGFVLESRLPMLAHGQTLAYAVTRIPLPAATEMLLAPGRSPTEELRVCAPDGENLRCFPSRLTAHVTSNAASHDQGSGRVPYPMTMATRGESGAMSYSDPRGRVFLAAYTPLDDLGVALVQRIEVHEVFAPVQRLLLVVVLLPLALAIVGVVVLRRGIHPLVERILESERDAQSARIKLEASESRVRSISDNLPALITYVDRDQRYEFVNGYLRDMFGADPSSLIGRTMQESCPPELWNSVAPQVARALAGERVSFEGETLMRGERRHHQTDYIPAPPVDGVVPGFYSLTFDITERKRSELKQRSDEHRLRTITDHVPGLVAYLDENERYQFANGYYRDAFELDPAQMIGRTVREVLGEVNYERIRAKLELARSGYPVTWEYHLETPGHLRDLQGSYLPDYGEGDRVKGIFIISYDITARKRTEEALRKSEERFRLMAENVTDYAILSLDTEGRVATWNAGAERIKGYGADEILGQHFEVFFTAEDRAAELPAALIETAERAGRVEQEGWRLRRDGSRFWGEVTLTALRAEDGALRGFGEVTRDLTERKAVEEALRASEQQMRTIADNLPVLICYIDPRQVFRYNNRQYELWLRRPLSEITNHAVREVYSADVYKQLAPLLERALAGEVVRAEIAFLGWNGSERHARVTYLPDRDAEGRVIGMHGLSSDFTQQRRAEQELWHLAQFDSLTGLPNRTQFNEKLTTALRAGDDESAVLALMFLDIDKFKAINDAHGHQAGDEVLKEFSRRLMASVRPSDTVCRLSGDEFVILLTGLRAADEAQFVARKILNAMRPDFAVAEQRLHVSTSIGIAVRRAGEQDSAALLKRADQALYQAKDAGRNGFRFLA